MVEESLIKRSLYIYILLFIALVSIAANAAPEAIQKTPKEIESISKVLTERTALGNNAYFNKVAAPALSLDTDKSKSDRTAAINQKLTQELATILTVFKNSTEDKKIESINTAINSIEPDLVKNSGAYVSFIDSNPSAAYSRTVLMIEKKSNVTVNSAKVLSILTSYKRSAKPSDHVYEYPSANNITEGTIKYSAGSDSTWKAPEASLAFTLGQDYVLKKCRQLLGWRCVTSIYQANVVGKSADQISYLMVTGYDLSNNPDHSDFSSDKRSTNQITGSTAIYIVKESAKWILLYGIDAQWNNGKLSFQGAIQTEFKKDADRFKERLATDLNLSINDIK